LTLMKKPRICAVIVQYNPAAIREIAPLADLFELRIDMVGAGWEEVVPLLGKPWLATNRRADEGGQWRGSEAVRVKELLRAVDLGAGIIDIELSTPGLPEVVRAIKGKAECLISHHDMKSTPSLDTLKELVNRQLAAGADIAKVVTTATTAEDNLTILNLVAAFPGVRLVTMAMGPLGLASRILSPLAGGEFTYASITAGKESAPGQLTVAELKKVYDTIHIG
jgi:3-dehydroquinate dehydratase I